MRPGLLLLVVLFVAGPWLALSVSAELATPLTDGAPDCLNAELPWVHAGWVQTGCCYANGGVCGCSAFGPVMCCDGRLSPTCMCRDDSPVTTLASYPR